MIQKSPFSLKRQQEAFLSKQDSPQLANPIFDVKNPGLERNIAGAGRWR
jgi:hypothetical protein